MLKQRQQASWRPVRRLLPVVAVVCSAVAGASAAPESGWDFPENNGGIDLPQGFQAFVAAESLGRARHLTVRDNGDVYVALRRPSKGGAVVALRDTTGDGRLDRIERFGRGGGTGIAIHQGYLYFAHNDDVVRYRLRPGELVPQGPPETVVTALPRQRSHRAKPIVFDDAGNLYVNVGAPSNACQESHRTPGSPGLDPCPELERHGGIWRFRADALQQTQTGDGKRMATGMRQTVAMDWNPLTGELYAVQHGRDQLHQLWPDRFTVEQNAELPAEEFLLIREGSNFGWPYCYYDHLQDKRVLAPEYGGDGEKVGRCDRYDDPILAFPGHWAPNDLLFYTGDQFPKRYRGGAFVAFHGSWNRAPLPQRGYNVIFVPFSGRRPVGEWETFADGFTGRERIRSPRQARFRPMGLALVPDGTLYISDSQKGRIWRVVYTGAQ